ncbi:MAG TPA: 50S ribosomal protein L11 methyltransferase [Mycobacteriales bacterium]|nr:50S ribosomal protein L11 methyltransferase [Mycobacteriales bacterium]
MRFASWLSLQPVPLVPELLLHQADDMHGLWQAVGGSSPPYWGFPWPGGQAVARHVLDHPALVLGKRVLDLATGSGLVALAAKHAGARAVLACDVDPLAGEALAANASANRLAVAWLQADLLDREPPDVDVVLAGDVLYEQEMAGRVLAWLDSFNGVVLLGDPGRDYLPHGRFTEVAAYDVPTTRELEGAAVKRTRVFRL